MASLSLSLTRSRSPHSPPLAENVASSRRREGQQEVRRRHGRLHRGRERCRPHGAPAGGQSMRARRKRWLGTRGRAGSVLGHHGRRRADWLGWVGFGWMQWKQATALLLTEYVVLGKPAVPLRLGRPSRRADAPPPFRSLATAILAIPSSFAILGMAGGTLSKLSLPPAHLGCRADALTSCAPRSSRPRSCPNRRRESRLSRQRREEPFAVGRLLWLTVSLCLGPHRLLAGCDVLDLVLALAVLHATP